MGSSIGALSRESADAYNEGWYDGYNGFPRDNTYVEAELASSYQTGYDQGKVEALSDELSDERGEK